MHRVLGWAGLLALSTVACGGSEAPSDGGGGATTAESTSNAESGSGGSESSDSESDSESGESGASETGGEQLPGGLVVDVAWLQRYLDDPRVQVIDTRASFGDHIPGAIALAPVAVATEIDGIAGQIMPPEDAESVLRAAGLENDTTAVVYGQSPEYDPARIVWALHYYEHGDVRYLDGGWPAWVDSGAATVPGDPEPPPRPSGYVVAGTDDSLRVTGAWVLDQLGDPPYDSVSASIVDARSANEYTAGRIPSATNIEWTQNLSAGLLRPNAELESLYADLDPSTTTVTYCLLGWRGSFDWLTLRWLGFDDVRLYDGSWEEWGGGAFPIETD
jgi:thiosulfate/3-mercaptopyruvate sulfurtransferase